MDDLRKPFLVAALMLMLIVVLIEVGSTFLLHSIPPTSGALSQVGPLPPALQNAIGSVDSSQVDQIASASDNVPGRGIPYLAILDGMVLFTTILLTSPLVLSDHLQGRIQGCVTAILAIILIITAIAMIILALVFLLIMVTLFLAVPFGTIAYLALYGFFNRSGASAVLSILLLLKIAFAVCLVLAQQRFLQNRGLILIVLSSLIANIVVSFLQGFLPLPLVSITDDIAAIIVAVCGCLWWVLALLGAIPAILKAIQARA